MASIICTNFAGNAWKKDLCSNCFKSEVEHNDGLVRSSQATAPVPQLQQTNHLNINHEGLCLNLYSLYNY